MQVSPLIWLQLLLCEGGLPCTAQARFVLQVTLALSFKFSLASRASPLDLSQEKESGDLAYSELFARNCVHAIVYNYMHAMRKDCRA